MIDLRKPPNLEKIGWFFNGIVKLNVVIFIFVISLILALAVYFFLDDIIILGLALILSFLIFPILPIVLVFLLNKYRLVERLTDDWYHEN